MGVLSYNIGTSSGKSIPVSGSRDGGRCGLECFIEKLAKKNKKNTHEVRLQSQNMNYSVVQNRLNQARHDNQRPEKQNNNTCYKAIKCCNIK